MLQPGAPYATEQLALVSGKVLLSMLQKHFEGSVDMGVQASSLDARWCANIHTKLLSETIELSFGFSAKAIRLPYQMYKIIYNRHHWLFLLNGQYCQL